MNKPDDPLTTSLPMAFVALLFSESVYLQQHERQTIKTELAHNAPARDQYQEGAWPTIDALASWKKGGAEFRSSLRRDLFGCLAASAVAVGIVCGLVAYLGAVSMTPSKWGAACAAVVALWTSLFGLRPIKPSNKGARIDEQLRPVIARSLQYLAGTAALVSALLA